MDHEKREALRLLTGIENGTMSAADAYNIADKLDPVMVYFILRFLREKYPSQEPTSQGVATRIVELTSTYDSIVKASKAGERDILREWFDDSYAMREFFNKPEEFVSLIVEKIEG